MYFIGPWSLFCPMCPLHETIALCYFHQYLHTYCTIFPSICIYCSAISNLFKLINFNLRCMQCQLVTWSNLSLSLYGHRPQPNCNGRQSQIYYQAFQNRMTNRQFELKHECICTCYALFGIHVLAYDRCKW